MNIFDTLRIDRYDRGVPVQLEIHHYESIIAVIDTGSMKDAASQLLTSQSALSHRIAEAERRLGGELFDRRPGQAVRPTAAARMLYQTAVAVLPELQRAEQNFVATGGSSHKVIRIGVAIYDAYHWFEPLRAAIRNAGLDVTVDLASVGDYPLARLADGSVDIVLAPGMNPGPAFERHAIDDELVLIASPHHPLAARESIVAEDLLDVTYLTQSESAWPGFEYDRFIRPAGVRPRLVTVVEQTSSIVEMVAAGLGVSILSRWALRSPIEHDRVVTVRCGDGLPLQWATLIRSSDVDGPADQVAGLLTDALRSADVVSSRSLAPTCAADLSI